MDTSNCQVGESQNPCDTPPMRVLAAFVVLLVLPRATAMGKEPAGGQASFGAEPETAEPPRPPAQPWGFSDDDRHDWSSSVYVRQKIATADMWMYTATHLPHKTPQSQ